MVSVRPLPWIVVALSLTVASAGLAAPSPAAAARADFSGAWKLNEERSTKVADLLREDGAVQGGSGSTGSRGESGGRRGGGRGGSSGAPGLEESAFQLLEDERRIVVADDGETVRITRGRGQKRMLYPDGEERELDDGDGPAAVTAKRKGEKGERIVVSSRWSTGRTANETWELLSSPRRLIVTTKVSSRKSFTVQRVYDPAPEGSLVTVVTAPPAVPDAAKGDVSPVEPAASAAPAAPPAGLGSCSIHPPRNATGPELARLAKVSQAAAERRALDFVAPRRPTSVITSEAEVYEGCLVWTFVLRFPERKGVQEIAIDAGDGKLLTSEVEATGTEGAQKP